MECKNQHVKNVAKTISASTVALNTDAWNVMAVAFVLIKNVVHYVMNVVEAPYVLIRRLEADVQNAVVVRCVNITSEKNTV